LNEQLFTLAVRFFAKGIQKRSQRENRKKTKIVIQYLVLFLRVVFLVFSGGLGGLVVSPRFCLKARYGNRTRLL
jgi:uncharacterized membrane protein SpoIIM required for sporulation